MARSKYFWAFNGLYYRAWCFSEPAPLLLHNMVSLVVSESFASKILTTWNCALHKIYGVSGMRLDNVLMYTGCLPIQKNYYFVDLNF